MTVPEGMTNEELDDTGGKLALMLSAAIGKRVSKALRAAGATEADAQALGMGFVQPAAQGVLRAFLTAEGDNVAAVDEYVELEEMADGS